MTTDLGEPREAVRRLAVANGLRRDSGDGQLGVRFDRMLSAGPDLLVRTYGDLLNEGLVAPPREVVPDA
jgi:hypothetical protein